MEWMGASPASGTQIVFRGRTLQDGEFGEGCGGKARTVWVSRVWTQRQEKGAVLEQQPGASRGPVRWGILRQSTKEALEAEVGSDPCDWL